MKTTVQFYSMKDGNETIAICHLVELFSVGDLSTWSGISRACGVPRLPKGTDLRIFPVMDIDGDDRNRTMYKTGNLLKGVPFADLITPIYNEENLDEVMEIIGYAIDRSNKASSYNAASKRIDPGDFYRDLQATYIDGSPGITNMDVLMRCLLEHEPSFQSRLDRRDWSHLL